MTLVKPAAQINGPYAIPSKARTRIIDCDVHHQFDKTEALFPYGIASK